MIGWRRRRERLRLIPAYNVPIASTSLHVVILASSLVKALFSSGRVGWTF